MMRPKAWEDLPFKLRESFVNEADLDYDHYDGSLVEAQSILLNDPHWHQENYDRVQSLYNACSDNELRHRTLTLIEGVERDIQNLKDFIL